MGHFNEQLIQNLYTAFSNKDYKGMNICYHPDATFTDPVFLTLKGKQIFAMWHMLCEAGKDLKVTLQSFSADDKVGKATWEAVYTFSSTGNKVNNKINSIFTFQDSLIIYQKDDFDLYKWARMALGSTGTFLGWLPALQNKIRNTADKNLNSFTKNHPEYAL